MGRERGRRRRSGDPRRGSGGDGDGAPRLLSVDPGSADSIRGLQRTLGLDEDGVLGPQTRAALRALRRRNIDAAPAPAGGCGLLPDPLDGSSIIRFQQQHGLPAEGRIDEATQEAIRAERRRSAGVDPADPESVRRFQRDVGLAADGILGPATQGGLAAKRVSAASERDEEDAGSERHDGDGGDDRASDGEARAPWPVDPLLGLDPADGESIRRFQRTHGLAADGVIGRQTQATLRALRAEQRSSAHAEGRSRRRRQTADPGRRGDRHAR